MEAVNVPAAGVPLVDCHAHVYTLDMPLSATAWHRPPDDATVEQYLSELDRHGVRHAVLAAASLYDDYNDYSIAAVKRHPRLRTTVIVRPDTDPYVLRMMKADGVVGVRLQLRKVAQLPDLTTAEYRRFLRRVADLDWHVHINVDAHALQVPVESIQAAGVKLVVDHFGHPDSTRGADCAGFQALLRAVERGRTWVKLSAGYRLAVPEAGATYAQALLKHAGPERLLWGSDWPFAAFESKVSYRETLEAFARWVPDAAQRRIIGGETPLALYFS